jgi:hypothetical protein
MTWHCSEHIVLRYIFSLWIVHMVNVLKIMEWTLMMKEELSTFKKEIREENSGCLEKSIRKFQETASKHLHVYFK